jgi:hypothetical protein
LSGVGVILVVAVDKALTLNLKMSGCIDTSTAHNEVEYRGLRIFKILTRKLEVKDGLFKWLCGALGQFYHIGQMIRDALAI